MFDQITEISACVIWENMNYFSKRFYGWISCYRYFEFIVLNKYYDSSLKQFIGWFSFEIYILIALYCSLI